MSDHSPHCNELDRPAVVAPAERGVRPLQGGLTLEQCIELDALIDEYLKGLGV